MQHIVIRREPYVAGTHERPEVGIFTQTHTRRRPVPWGRISVNDRVWMKWQAGWIVARARVKAYRQLEHCTPGQLRATTVGYRLHDLPDYWVSLPPLFRAVVVYLKDEEWLDRPIEPRVRSYGESWIVLDNPGLIDGWLPVSSPPRIEQDVGIVAQSRRIRPSLRFAVLRRDNFRCRYCGRTAAEVTLHIDHWIPDSRGGPTILDNLITACRDCNLGKGARRIAERPDAYSTCPQGISCSNGRSSAS